MRANIRSTSDADVAKAVAYGKRVKFYPFAQADNPPATTFVDFLGTLYDNTIPYDLSFFQLLDRFVQREPWLPRDRVMIDTLRYMSMLVINEDHYAQAFYYAPGTYTLDRKGIGTRYVATAVRTLVDPNDPKDVKAVHALQDAITSTQQSPGNFDIPE